jgi:TolB protein
MSIGRALRLVSVIVVVTGFHWSAATAQPVQITFSGDNAYHPKWSPDGTRIAYTKRAASDVGVWMMPAAGGTAQQLDLGKTGDLAFSWSPDGSKIVFDAYPASGPPGNLYVIDLPTGNVRQLTDYNGSENHPDWSPGGSTIAFTWKGEIWTIPAGGGSPTRITSGHNDWHPCWSPDGTTIAFTSDRSGDTNIFTVRATGGVPRQITTHPEDDDRASWSPDGTRIVFNSNRSGSVDIWTITLADGALERITTHSACDSHANWSPDGSKIAFASQRGGSFDVWVMDTRAGAR